MNNHSEKNFFLKNIKSPKTDFFSEISETINDNIPPKFLSSRNPLNKLKEKNNSDLSLSSSKKSRNIINFKTTFNSPNQSKLILRQIDLELSKIINKAEKKKSTNFKTVGKNIRNNFTIFDIKTVKNKEVNKNDENQQQIQNFKSKNNNRIIKNNYSEINLDTIHRKIIYFNQKNDLISKENIINLNQKEENSLFGFINNHNKRNKPNIKFLSHNNNQKRIIESMNRAKSAKKVLKDNGNSNNQKLELEKLLKIINKNYDLKTNYKKETEIYENENNVDNCVKKNEKNSYINFFNNFNKKNNNELEDENDINKIRRIKSFSDVYNDNISMKNEFIKKNIKSLENQDTNNKIMKENKIKKTIGRLSLPKFNFNNILNKDYHINNRKRKSIIEGYLSNSNIKSAKYFNTILNDKDKFQFNSTIESNQNKRGSQQLILEYGNQLNKQRIFRNSNHNNDFNINQISNNDKSENFSKNDELEIEKATELSKKHKLYEKNISDINIIYGENEQENKNDNFQNTYPYFSPNNKRRINIKSKKNKDISKFLDNNTPENQQKVNHSEIKKEKKINKYDYFNTIRTQRKNNFNKPKNMKKDSTNFGYKKNNYILSRNIHMYSLKKSYTNIKSSYNKRDKNVIEKNDINEKSEEEEELEDKNVSEKHDRNNIQDEIKKNALNKDISIKELSVLDNNKIEQKEKFKIIKEFKDKAIFNIFCIVNKILKEKQHLQLNIENLTKFPLVDSYKKYVNILKQLIEKERAISNLSKFEKVKDAEIIKYIHRIFSDEYSSFYIKPKKDNLDNSKTITTNLSNFLKDYDSNSNLLSHKRYLSMNNMKKNTGRRKTKRESTKKISIDINNIISKKPFQKKKSIENQKTIKQFLEYKIEDKETQKRDFLMQKLNLTKELRYQIEITHDEEGKIRFQTLLDQIEALKNDDIMDYIKFIHEKYENFKKEIKRLVNEREKEERINYFLNELIYERENINKVKQITGRYVSFEDYKF